MSVTSNALVVFTGTRWNPPLPSHQFSFYGSVTGDGSGGAYNLLLKLLSDSPVLNVPPVSLEDLAVFSAVAKTVDMSMRIGGGALDLIQSCVKTCNLGTSFYYADPGIVSGLHMIRPRSPKNPFTDSTFLLLAGTNVNTEILQMQGWGYLWQIPEQWEPWHPGWGSPPAFKSL